MDVRLGLRDAAKDLIRDRKLWDRRFSETHKAAQLAYDNYGLFPTPYFVEAIHYWRRASHLQSMNLGILYRVAVGDLLQEHIPIYDTVNRRYAGFSNALEQAYYGTKSPKYEMNKTRGYDFAKFIGPLEAWLYICLVHRITGSGASFEKDHGWRNTIVPELVDFLNKSGSIDEAGRFMRDVQKPIFTSIGNQIPPFNKRKNPKIRNAGQEYLYEIGPKLVRFTVAWLKKYREANKRSAGIQDTVDEVLKIQGKLGCKRFVFVLTAWVMDIAEYVPTLVDPNSDCYHGKNAMEAMETVFDRRRSVQRNAQKFYDEATRFFADFTGTKPMDVEDASPGCDLIRWLENYVPKNGFDYVHRERIFNSSSLLYHKGRQP